jgi:hypothetical protein
MDDDPLTSPSFPAVNASDSRSYRSAGPPSGPHTGPQAASDGRRSNGRSTGDRSTGDRGGARNGNGSNGGYSEPAAQFSQYPPTSQAHSQPIMQPPAPVANPYGSYVSTPQPAYQDVAAAQPDTSAYGGYAGMQQADGTWYGGAANGTPASGDVASGYLPSPSYDETDQAGNGYAEVDYRGISYQGAAYQAGPSAPGGYGPQGNLGGQYDQSNYGSPELAYGQEGYQGYPGYGPAGR